MQEKSSLTDSELVDLVQTASDSEAIKILINRHSGIFVSVCKKLSQAMPDSGFYDELFDGKDTIIFEAAKTFDEDKGSKFSTWLANQTRYYCLNKIHKEEKYVHCDEETIQGFFDGRAKDYAKEAEISSDKKDKLDQIRDILENLESENIKRVIMEKYFAEDGCKVTFTEIALKMNVSVQTVINWHKKFVNFAKNKLK